MTNCTKCSQVINEIVTIDGKPYGTTCAKIVLGINAFPNWFKGGDWNKAKSEQEIISDINNSQYEKCLKAAKEKWELGAKIWIAEVRARVCQREFESNFLRSIAEQLGIGYFEPELTPTAESYFKMHNGSNGVINLNGKSVDDLSVKQLNLLNKFLSTCL